LWTYKNEVETNKQGCVVVWDTLSLLVAERNIEKNKIHHESNIKREEALENKLGLDVDVADW